MSGAAYTPPRRERLAEALACVTDLPAAMWRVYQREPLPGTRFVWDARGAAYVRDLPIGPTVTSPGAGPRVALVGPVAPTVTDPRQAWEALATAGVIPDDWVEDPRRAFDCGADRSAPPRALPPGGRWERAVDPLEVLDLRPRWHWIAPHPPTVAACVALAADVAGVLAAEAFAREVVARLAPWGGPQPQRVAWRMVDLEREAPRYYYHRPSFLDHPAVALTCNGSRGWVVPRDPETPRAKWAAAHETARLLCGDWKTQAAAGRKVAPPREARDGSRVRGLSDAPRALWKARLRDLPNPFEPLVELWATGYVLDAYADDAVVIACPALGESG